MRAPDRRQSKRIGAWWLRDNMARLLAGNYEESSLTMTIYVGDVNEHIIIDTQTTDAGMGC